MQKKFMTPAIRLGFAVGFVLLLFPTYLAHMLTSALISEPTLLEEGTSQATVDAEWAKIKEQQKDEYKQIDQEWIDFMKEHQPNEDDWVDWAYWQASLSNNSDQLATYLGNAAENALQQFKSTMGWLEDTSIDAVNESKMLAYKGEVYIAYPVIRGIIWIIGLFTLMWVLLQWMYTGLNTVSFGMYDKAKSGLNYLKIIPFLAPIISVGIVILEIYIAYKVGLTKVVYWFASLPDISGAFYSLFGWNAFSGVLLPTLCMAVLFGLITACYLFVSNNFYASTSD